MEKQIIYNNGEGGVSVIIPSPNSELSISDVAKKDVPRGTAYEIVDVTQIPTDRTFRNAWIKNGSAIGFDMDKCKAITHDKRRSRRAELLAPYDEVVSKRIPGENLASAEDARAKIRADDAALQSSIDACQSVDELLNVAADIL